MSESASSVSASLAARLSQTRRFELACSFVLLELTEHSVGVLGADLVVNDIDPLDQVTIVRRLVLLLGKILCRFRLRLWFRFLRRRLFLRFAFHIRDLAVDIGLLRVVLVRA